MAASCAVTGLDQVTPSSEVDTPIIISFCAGPPFQPSAARYSLPVRSVASDESAAFSRPTSSGRSASFTVRSAATAPEAP
jgi:hypothetical protein